MYNIIMPPKTAPKTVVTPPPPQKSEFKLSLCFIINIVVVFVLIALVRIYIVDKAGLRLEDFYMILDIEPPKKT